MMTQFRVLLFVIFAATLALCACPALAGVTTRVSVASDGTQGNGDSGDSGTSISADGRFVAFYSDASDLVPGDTNTASDVFVHDRQTGQTTRVSVASDGTQGNYESRYPSISADGRFVAFDSSASNLVPGDTNGYRDVFVHDRQTGQTTRVSVSGDGTQGNSNTGFPYGPSVSADGRFVAFDSSASNLVPADTNGYRDVFVHDRQTGETTRVSVSSNGTQGDSGSYDPSISADGRFVAFYAYASNLVFGDTNGLEDIFVHDRQTGVTERVSAPTTGGGQSKGESYYPSISADGRYVAFWSYASNLVLGDTNGCDDVFVRDRLTGQTTRVSVSSDGTQGNSYSYGPSISTDGRYVMFHSYASNLVPDDTNACGDVFMRDRQTGETMRVSVSGDGTQGNGESRYPSISADGRFVAFDSSASNLVSGDTNGYRDVFVHDRWVTGTISLIKAQPDGTNVGVDGKVVTAGNDQFTSMIYILEDDRSSGIKVYGAAGTIRQGDKVDVVGVMSTESTERMITSPTVTLYTGPFPEPKALSLPTTCVGGASLNNYTPGVAGGLGVHNTGLVVQVWGRVTYVNATSKYFYVDDGCGKLDGSGYMGVQALCAGRPLGATPITLPALNSYVTVTGISSRKLLSGSTYIPIIRPRTQSDIVEYP
jgi:Tol biopolymer transport system component